MCPKRGCMGSRGGAWWLGSTGLRGADGRGNPRVGGPGRGVGRITEASDTRVQSSQSTATPTLPSDVTVQKPGDGSQV